MPDNVNHPTHYNTSKFEVWDVLDAWFPQCPLLWQVGKYIARADRKGAPIEDLKKARVYLDREIEKREWEQHPEPGSACPKCKDGVIIYTDDTNRVTGCVKCLSVFGTL